MRTVFRWLAPLIVTSAASMSACSSTSNTPADDGTVVPESSEPSELAVAMPSEAPVAAAPQGEPQQFEGRLTYTELPRTKSVEAYLGVEFRLQTANGEVVLTTSETVNREALVAANGKDVKVTCTMRAGAVPDPHESYPMNADGTPMKRPDKCVVTALTL